MTSKLNGSIFRKPVRTQGATKGTNKGEQRLAGHILRLLACLSFRFTHRIFAITPHLSACEREPGASEILAWGAIGSGVPKGVDGGGGGGGRSSDPWSASAAQSCQVLLTTKGRGRGDCDGGVAHRVTLSPHSRPPGLNPAVAAAAQSAAGTGAEPWRSLTPIPPLQDTVSQGGGPGERRHCRAASLTRPARSSLPLGRPSPPPPPPHPPRGERASRPPTLLAARAQPPLCSVEPQRASRRPRRRRRGRSRRSRVGPACEARPSGSPTAATRLRGPPHPARPLSARRCRCGVRASVTHSPAPRPASRHHGHQTPSAASRFPRANHRCALLDAGGGAKMGRGSEGKGLRGARGSL